MNNMGVRSGSTKAAHVLPIVRKLVGPSVLYHRENQETPVSIQYLINEASLKRVSGQDITRK